MKAAIKLRKRRFVIILFFAIFFGLSYLMIQVYPSIIYIFYPVKPSINAFSSCPKTICTRKQDGRKDCTTYQCPTVVDGVKTTSTKSEIIADTAGINKVVEYQYDVVSTTPVNRNNEPIGNTTTTEVRKRFEKQSEAADIFSPRIVKVLSTVTTEQEPIEISSEGIKSPGKVVSEFRTGDISLGVGNISLGIEGSLVMDSNLILFYSGQTCKSDMKQHQVFWSGTDEFGQFCRLQCDEDRILRHECIPATPVTKRVVPNEIVCGGEGGRQKIDKNTGNVLETCESCVNGSCVAKVGNECDRVNEVKPMGNDGRFVYCGDDNTWHPYANGQVIYFSDNCPNIFRTTYLEQGIGGQDTLLNGVGVSEIECAAKGDNGARQDRQSIILTCDPLIKPDDFTSPHSCFTQGYTNTIMHEWAHLYENLHPDAQESFCRLIGYEEGPNGSVFSETNSPLMPYGQFNCNEAWATSADIYSDPQKACQMKNERPLQYEFFNRSLNSPFKDREYCEEVK